MWLAWRRVASTGHRTSDAVGFMRRATIQAAKGALQETVILPTRLGSSGGTVSEAVLLLPAYQPGFRSSSPASGFHGGDAQSVVLGCFKLIVFFFNLISAEAWMAT